MPVGRNLEERSNEKGMDRHSKERYLINMEKYTKSRKLVYKRIIALLLVAAMFFTGSIPIQAASIAEMEAQEQETQTAISNLQKQTQETQAAISNLQGQRQQVEQNVNALQHQSSALQSTINDYNAKMDTLNEEISETEQKMADTSKEILDTNAELEEAEEHRRQEYEQLKIMVKNMYESGGKDALLNALISGGSIRDILNRVEYVSAIVAYQKKVIANYQALCDEIEEQKEYLESKQQEIDEYQKELDDKQDELAKLTDGVMSELSETKGNISSQKDKLANYDAQLKDLDKKMKQLEAQTAAAQAELAKQIAKRLEAMENSGMREDTSGAYAASASELEWLAATIQAEADGESYNGKLAVGSVIMNRVKSSSFPNSIVAVITQNMQFASYRSGKVELIISRGPNSTCVQAAQEVLNGARVGDYLFFMTKYYADYYRIADYTMIGNHAFFYRWKVKEEVQESPAPEAQPEAPAEEVSEETSEESNEESHDDEESSGDDDDEDE